MEVLAVVLFMSAWAVGVGAWCLAIVETVGMWQFWSWVYRCGFKLIDENLSVAIRPNLPSQVIDLPTVKAKVRPNNGILFRAPLGFKLYTPLPIKATIVVSSGNIRIVGRIPVGFVAFLAAWLVAWTIGGTMMAIKGSATEAALSVLLGWGFAATIAAISLPIELRRIGAAKAALADYLGKAGQSFHEANDTRHRRS